CYKAGPPPFGNGVLGPGPSCWPWACCAAGGAAPSPAPWASGTASSGTGAPITSSSTAAAGRAATALRPSCSGPSRAIAPATSPSAWTLTRLRRSGKKIKTAFWGRDPLSPPFRANLLWGQRFLQASLLVPLYRKDGQSSPRGLPVRFEEVPAVRKPGKKASPEAQAAYRHAQKAHNLSTAFGTMVQELRHSLDALGFAQKLMMAVGDGSFCNRTTFRQGVERTVLITRARKNLRLCFPHPGPGRRVYGEKRFSPEEVYKDKSRPW